MTNNLGLINGGDINFAYSKGGGTDVGASMALMGFQDRLWRDSTQWYNENGYKFLRQGLINADYNPILAIMKDPLSAPMASATATQPTESFSWDGASGMQANTARQMSESQINLNKSTAHKTDEEADTQRFVRSNLVSQTLLNFATSDRIKRLLPLEERKMLVDIAVGNSIRELNEQTTAYIPKNAETARISATAQQKNAETSAKWTPVGIGAGIGAGLVGFGIGKIKSMFKRPVGFR